MNPELHAAPLDGLIDDPLDITVDGLPSGIRATVVARFACRGRRWRGEATFEANGDTCLDLTEQAPIAGDYDGVRPMGIVQFARQLEERDDRPVDDDFAVEDGYRLHLSVEIDGSVVSEETVVRRSLATTVERIVVEDTTERLVGDLFLPSGDGPHPGLVFLGGSEGGIPNNIRAKLLASRGYAVLSLAYFQPSSIGGPAGQEDRALSRLPERLVDVPLDYFDRAVEWLASHGRIDADRLGVFGGSRGTEPAIFLAARNDVISAVILVAPLAYAFTSFQEIGEPAWVDGRDPLPFLANRIRPRDFVRFAWRKLSGGGIPFAQTFVAAVENSSDCELEATALPVEDIERPILTLAGAADELVPSVFMSERLHDRLAQRGVEHEYRYYRYPNAGHRLSPPYMPVRGRNVGEASVFLGAPLAFGGTTVGYAAADVDSWDRILSFLKYHLG